MNFKLQQTIKLIFDLLAALVVLIITSPLLLSIILILAVRQRGQIFFSQKRVGLEERVFKLYKFKTMMDFTGADGQLLPDELRVTRIGNILRKYSLDELPQLINILKGDISLVGPRPLLVEYLQYYSEEQKKRHSVKPGLTGLAQVKGRNLLTWKSKFEYDVEYVKKWSLLLDFKILLKTFLVILDTSDIQSEGGKFMPKFNGKN